MILSLAVRFHSGSLLRRLLLMPSLAHSAVLLLPAVDTFKAKDVMSAPITTFRHKEKVRNIVQTLVSCRHHAFPVVLTPKDKQILDSRNKCASERLSLWR
jgi:CBS-domain-containing membrane protein